MNTEMIFWAIALLMAVVACLSVAAAFLRPKIFSNGGSDPVEVSRALLNDELDVLKAELAAGAISQAIYEESVVDVKRRALEDLSASAVKTNTDGRLNTTVGASVCAVVVAAAFGIYLMLGSPSLIVFADSVQKHGIMQEDGTLADAGPQYDVQTMKAYLAENRKDERAWTLYARLLVQEQNWEAAAQAYQSAIDLNGKVSQDPEVLLEYAASLMSLQTQDAYRKGYDAVRRALALDETNRNAHELAAIACLELQMWRQAREHLETLLQGLSFDTPSYRSIAETAAYAAQRERQEAQEHKENN